MANSLADYGEEIQIRQNEIGKWKFLPKVLCSLKANMIGTIRKPFKYNIIWLCQMSRIGT
jgi:hypothetical protein